MSVCFLPLGTTTLKRSTDQSRNSRIPRGRTYKLWRGDFNAELGPRYGVERVSVGPHTLEEGNKRGDWMKQWLLIQNFTALNTMYRKTLEKQATHRTPKGAEKQLDDMLVDRKHMCCSWDDEANDMIHMGSDHRSVMAQFVITAQKKEVS